MQGRLSTWRLAAKKDESGEYTAEYRVRLVDPMQKLNSMELHYLLGAVPVPSVSEFRAAPAALNGAKSIELKARGAMGRRRVQGARFRGRTTGCHGATILDRWLE